jgi:hypothetical protein
MTSRTPGGHERDRRRPATRPTAHVRPVDDRLAGLAPVPAQVQREGEEHAGGHEAEADEVEVALLEDGQPRRPGQRRAVRAGLLAALRGRGHRLTPSVRPRASASAMRGERPPGLVPPSGSAGSSQSVSTRATWMSIWRSGRRRVDEAVPLAGGTTTISPGPTSRSLVAEEERRRPSW